VSTTPLITPDLVAIDLVAADRAEATRHLVGLMADAGRVTDAAGFLADVQLREAQMATGMPGGVGLPHARSAHVKVPSLAVAQIPGGVDFGAPDGPATLVFLIAAPATGDADHLKILAALARRLVHESFRTSLKEAADAQTVADIITREVVPS
jgi:fructose PTS system EIIA component